MQIVVDIISIQMLLVMLIGAGVITHYAVRIYLFYMELKSMKEDRDRIILMGLQLIIDRSVSDTIEDYELAAEAKKVMDIIKKSNQCLK